MRLSHVSWVHVKEYFQTNDLVLIPLGSTECHGKHNPLGTDFLVPDKLLDLIEPKLSVLIAPTLPYGSCDEMLGFPGTISLGDEVLLEVLRKITDALYSYGVRRFAFINGHGGNLRALDRVSRCLHRRGAWAAILNWWQIAPELNPAWKGGHGGAEESAAVMAIDPALVDASLLAPMQLRNDAGDAIETTGFETVSFQGVPVRMPRDLAAYSANGWIGPDDPKQADAQWGTEMLETTAGFMVRFLQEFAAIPLPAPLPNP